jgi:aryl-alcohol dehydrogenase-like predicted oxidoreductase
MIGNWMTRRGHVPRLVTKTFNPMGEGEDHGLSRQRMGRQLDSSLRRLGSDQVDLYLAHEFDPDVPLTETISTFASLITLGLVRAWGVSNVSADQLRQILAVAQPAAVQNSYSLLERGDEEEVVKICAELGIAYTPFSPLAGGWLTGKYKPGQSAPEGSRMTLRPEPYAHLQTEETFAALERFEAAATRRGVDMSTLAIAWVLAQSFVTAVIVGPRRPSHLDAAARAAELRVSKSEADEIAALFD